MVGECRLCGARTSQVFEARLMKKFDVKYFLCDDCGLLQTERPYWLEEAYGSAINASDTGIMRRAAEQSRIISAIIFTCFDPQGRFVDYGGGYGIFTRLMRDIGFDYYWTDPHAENLVSRGFEYDGKGNVEMVSSLETFEHFVEPGRDIRKMLEISRCIVFSTELLPENIPRPEDWWYYGLEHGQHIAFYSRRTMDHLARTHGLNYYRCGQLHLLCQRDISRTKLRMLEMLPPALVDWWVTKHMRSRTADDMRSIIDRAGVEQIKVKDH